MIVKKKYDIEPVKRLSFKAKVVRFCIVKYSEGTIPVRLLDPRLRNCNDFNWLKSIGIWPEIRLFEIS